MQRKRMRNLSIAVGALIVAHASNCAIKNNLKFKNELDNNDNNNIKNHNNDDNICCTQYLECVNNDISNNCNIKNKKQEKNKQQKEKQH